MSSFTIHKPCIVIISIVTILLFFSQYSFIKSAKVYDQINSTLEQCQIDYSLAAEELSTLQQLPLFNMNPTMKQVESVVKEDKVNLVPYDDETFSCIEYSFGLINAFLEKKIHACITWIIFEGYEEFSHSIVAVNTEDKGVIYIEPQSDKIITSLRIGDDYCNKADMDCDWKITNIKSCYSDIYTKSTFIPSK